MGGAAQKGEAGRLPHVRRLYAAPTIDRTHRRQAASRHPPGFLVRCGSSSRRRHDAPDPQPHRRFVACSISARASANARSGRSPSRCSTGWTSTRRRSIASIRRGRRNTAMPMPESIGCFALRRSGGFVVALRDGFWLARADGKLERKVGDAPYDPAHHRFNDGRCDRAGAFFRRLHERSARCGHGGARAPRSRFAQHERALRDDDQQRPRVEPRRPHDVSRRYADAGRSARSTTTRDRNAEESARVRAASPAKASVPTAAPSTAKAATGPRSIAAARSCGSRPTAACSPSSRCRRCARRCARSAAAI